jgi:hypothetical protein
LSGVKMEDILKRWKLEKFFSKKGSDYNIHRQKSNKGIPKKKIFNSKNITAMRQGKGNETKNPRCDKEQNLDHDRLKINKMVQSIQISPKTERGL